MHTTNNSLSVASTYCTETTF